MPDQPAPDPSGGYDAREFVAEFYDHVVPYRDRQDVSFWVDMARESGGPVLEIGCGTGRVLIPTARADIEIVGLDLSTQMLAVCRRRLSEESADVQSRATLVQADMRDFDLGREFSLITTPFRPFQHLLTVDDQLACLRSVHRHLAANGRFILDLFNPRLERLIDDSYLEERDEEPPFTLPDGRTVVRFHRVASRDLLNQTQQVELIYHVTHPSGRQERLVHAFPMRYLFRFEADHLLARCGFAVESIYANFDKSPYGSEYPGELVFVARRA